MSFKYRTYIYMLISVSVISIFSFIGWIIHLDVFVEKYLSDFSIFDLLISQISNTLLVLSLTSVLSTDFGQAYWIDIRESKLIYPFFSCFTGITVYLLSGLVLSIICYAIRFNVGVLVSFLLSTLLLVILTFKMISIYFGKENLKCQMTYEYKKMVILGESFYVYDYLRDLEAFEKECEKKDFPNKRKFISMLKKEINDIRNESDADKSSKEYNSKLYRGIEELKVIDEKIIEYTRNAIHTNDHAIIQENIELLVDSGNYNTFFNLIEDLFDWDEEYTCRILKKLNGKGNVWMKERMDYFKQYALHKLVSDSGKLTVLQYLLFIYDPTNLGMSKIEDQIEPINQEAMKCWDIELSLSRELSEADDIHQCMKAQKNKKEELEERYQKLKAELLDILSKQSEKDLRSYYVPIQETYNAYMERRYKEVNKLVKAIIQNFRQDLLFIKTKSGIEKIHIEIDFDFSYVTENEMSIINQIINIDKSVSVIPESDKEMLLSMNKAHIDNGI